MYRIWLKSGMMIDTNYDLDKILSKVKIGFIVTESNLINKDEVSGIEQIPQQEDNN